MMYSWDEGEYRNPNWDFNERRFYCRNERQHDMSDSKMENPGSKEWNYTNLNKFK